MLNWFLRLLRSGEKQERLAEIPWAQIEFSDNDVNDIHSLDYFEEEFQMQYMQHFNEEDDSSSVSTAGDEQDS